MVCVQTSALEIAKRFLGLHEEAGLKDHPFIVWCLRLCKIPDPIHDEIPWCSAFCVGIAHLFDRDNPYSARARSWLKKGVPIGLDIAEPGFDIVVLKRGGGNQPGPEVIEAPGHVGFFVSKHNKHVEILGGNQDDGVSIQLFPVSQILGIRRI